jgi:hypothetical protein
MFVSCQDSSPVLHSRSVPFGFIRKLPVKSRFGFASILTLAETPLSSIRFIRPPHRRLPVYHEGDIAVSIRFERFEWKRAK